MVFVSRLAVLIVIHKELTNGSACHRGNVLHWSRIGCGSCNNDGLVKNTMAGKRLADVCNCRRLLTDGDIDTNHIGVLLVYDCVNCDSGLTGLTVTNDQLTLTTADRNHSVNCQKSSLNWLANRLTLHDARSLELNRATMCSVDSAKSINRLAQWVNNTTKHVKTSWNIHDAAGCTALVAFLNLRNFAEQNSAD